MPKFLINPITGEFDLVGDGSGGGGSGTVTAVSGGVGITNVPDPIVGAGSVNLDINDLTAESTLAAGDLFAFVDVSSGTTFADQRKVTFGDITAAIAASGTPMAADCASAPALLCLGGRTGTTNDPTISSDANGTITGSAAAGGFMFLRGTSVPATFSQVNIAENNVLFLRPITVAGLGGALFFRDNADAFNTAFIAGTQAADINYFLPLAQAAGADYVLGNDGAGNLAWLSPGTIASCANAPELLCLGGRPGPNNDPIICTDANGTITGSASSTAGLILNNNTTGAADGDNGIQLLENLVTLKGGFRAIHVSPASSISVDASAAAATYRAYHDQPVFILDDNMNAFSCFSFFAQPSIRTPIGVDALNAGNAITSYNDDAAAIADNAQLRISSMLALSHDAIATVIGTGTVQIDLFGGVFSKPLGQPGSHVDDYVGFQVAPNLDACDNAVGFDVFLFNGNYANTPISFRSQFGDAYMSHVGRAAFGSAAGQPVPTNASCGLELQSTTTAFLPSRMDTTARNALTALNAMFLYDTDDTKFQGYENGAWVNFTTTVA